VTQITLLTLPTLDLNLGYCLQGIKKNVKRCKKGVGKLIIQGLLATSVKHLNVNILLYITETPIRVCSHALPYYRDWVTTVGPSDLLVLHADSKIFSEIQLLYLLKENITCVTFDSYQTRH